MRVPYMTYSHRAEQVFYDAPHPCIASADDIHSSVVRPKQQPSHGSIRLYDRH